MSVLTDTVETGEESENPILTPVREWWARVRGGDIGSIPAVLGFVVLVIFFSAAQGDTFATEANWANLLNQAAAVIFIAMGLIFVLLLGEIDLSAGYLAGAAGAVLAVSLTKNGQSWPVAVLLSLGFALLIGLAMGCLVALLGIPSFVVTLAAFLALQGVLLLIIGAGGTIRITDETILTVMNSNLSPTLGWVMFAVVVGGYALLTANRIRVRRASGLARVNLVLPLVRVLVLAVVMGLVVGLLNQERAVNPAFKSLKGVPYIVPITILFVVGLTFVLNRTAFGRHIYAVGGNTEAARRAGIKVAAIKISCFAISSTMAAIGGILLVSRDNSVSPSTGGSQTLLFAVGAAVIGGTSLFGGKGRVIDAVLGGMVIAVIGNGLPLITQKSEVQFIVTGLVLLVAASVDAISRRRAAATGR
jgi:D-xylose transport system permease protein